MNKKGRIIKNISNQYTVYSAGDTFVAVAMGKLRLGKRPIVGDYVHLEFIENQWVIQEVLERKNQLRRPLIANVDQALIVMSLKEPDFSFTLVDRLIFLISLEGIRPIIVVNKIDLGSETEIKEVISAYEPYGYQVILTSREHDSDEIVSVLENKLTVLAGQSGVGKSSIINRIDGSFELKTQEISRVLGRGKHTTRHNQLYYINDGWIADTPGFSSLDFKGINPLDLANTIPDFIGFAENCRFRDCIHQNEPGCGVKEAVEEGKILKQRYRNYLDCLELIKEDHYG